MAKPKEPQSYGSERHWSKVSPFQIEENAPANRPGFATGEDSPVCNVNMKPSGAKRQSYFSDRDYK